MQFLADFGYGTTLLGLWVRERGVLSLEHAIHKLTFQVAAIPEPGSLALMGMAAFGFAGAVWRRRQAARSGAPAGEPETAA